jgi:histidine triad (HIT) family protein
MQVQDCVFCKIVRGEEAAHIVYEDAAYIAFLDKYPRTSGHMQLIPRDHYRFVYDVPDMAGMFGTAQRIIRAIIPVLGASHVTIGAYGHEIHHAHVWIVPQYGSYRKVGEGLGKDTGHDQAPLARKLRTRLVKEV